MHTHLDELDDFRHTIPRLVRELVWTLRGGYRHCLRFEFMLNWLVVAFVLAAAAGWGVHELLYLYLNHLPVARAAAGLAVFSLLLTVGLCLIASAHRRLGRVSVVKLDERILEWMEVVAALAPGQPTWQEMSNNTLPSGSHVPRCRELLDALRIAGAAEMRPPTPGVGGIALALLFSFSVSVALSVICRGASLAEFRDFTLPVVTLAVALGGLVGFSLARNA